MSEHSKIEWTDHTFNPWWGCVKVSDGCKHCYALRDSKRYGHDIWGPSAPRRFFGDKHWNEPLRWNRAAERDEVRRRVFCASMADVFERHPRDEWNAAMEGTREVLWDLIDETPALDWLLLTKRPEHFATMLPQRWLSNPAPNVWLGVSAENQATADERIPLLLQAPAIVRFVSAEPLLGPIEFRHYPSRPPDWPADEPGPMGVAWDWLSPGLSQMTALDWIIAGGESGPGAREMHPGWVRSIRDQCVEADVAFHFKQWGEWHPSLGRVGKKAAGRELDGSTWDGFPL